MENQDEPSSWATRDFTIPLVLSGVVSTVVCIASCAVLYFSRDFINNDLAPRLGLVEPTPTITPTPAPVTCPAVPTGWVNIMENNFNANENAWYLGKEFDQFAISNASISDGVLHLNIKAFQEGGVYYYNFPDTNKSKTDFYLTSKVRQLDGSRDSEYGLIFRVKEGRHHFFSISNNRRFYLVTRDENGNWKDNIFGDYSKYIIPQAENELTVLGRGDHFIFCINHFRVGEVDNAKYPLGEFGIGVFLPQVDNNGVFEYDDFTIYTPEE